MSLCNCSHQFCKNIPVSFDFITTWNQGVFLWSPCTSVLITCSVSQVLSYSNFLVKMDRWEKNYLTRSFCFSFVCDFYVKIFSNSKLHQETIINFLRTFCKLPNIFCGFNCNLISWIYYCANSQCIFWLTKLKREPSYSLLTDGKRKDRHRQTHSEANSHSPKLCDTREKIYNPVRYMNFNQPISMTALHFSTYVRVFIQVQSVRKWKVIRL
jgi:hypothetical protein